MQLSVVLGSSTPEESFSIALYDNLFVNKWINELCWCKDHCTINQQDAFATLMSVEQASAVLRDSCATINKYLKGFVEIRTDIADQPQEYYNYLHGVFERLTGTFDQPTRLFAIANAELRTAIRNLNFYVHRIEQQADPLVNMYLNFDKDQYRRIPFAPEDYDFFEFAFPAGTLFLHYAELGKEYFDLYEDGLELDYTASANSHYYSGEASLASRDFNAFEDANFKQWLVDRNIDPYNKQLAHGKIPLGFVDDIDRVTAMLQKHKYINRIAIHE
jgi:hypothetical protein